MAQYCLDLPWWRTESSMLSGLTDMTATAQVHDRLATLADPTRGRILLALEQHELTVGELCSVLALPQSTVSRHLRLLAAEDWVGTPQEGTSRYYARNTALEPGADRLWSVGAEGLRGSPGPDL